MSPQVLPPVCVDCGAVATVTYMWATRCQTCADSFSEANRREALAKEEEWIKANPCETCGEPPAIAYYECQDCCEHEFDADEGYHCLSCGLDGSEDVAAAAYDRMKDFAKYGEW